MNLSLSPGVLSLLAVLSVGGLLFLGWQAEVVGNLVGETHVACCTIDVLQSAPTGFIQRGAVTSAEACSGFETAQQCCVRIAKTRGKRFSILGAREGGCVSPEVSYPTHAPAGGYSVCCSTEMWQHSPSGYAQGEAQTRTEYCLAHELPNQCCIRATKARYDYTFKLLGSKVGGCRPGVPQTAYPVWVPTHTGIPRPTG